MATRAVLAVTALVAIVVAADACSSPASHPKQNSAPSVRSPASARGTAVLDQSYSADGGTFRYPSGWRLSTYTDVSSFDTLVAFLSNHPIQDPCVHPEGNDSCSAQRLGRLGPAGVLVSWDIYGFPNYGIDDAPGSPTTIDGRPARLEVETPAAATECALMGGSQVVDVAVAITSLHGAGGLWRMTACVADPGAAKAVSTAITVARSLRLGVALPS